MVVGVKKNGTYLLLFIGFIGVNLENEKFTHRLKNRSTIFEQEGPYYEHYNWYCPHSKNDPYLFLQILTSFV
jgi:hypothetical protein